MDELALYNSILNFVNQIIPKNTSLPKYKFIYEGFLGVFISTTLIITEIVRAISDVEDFKATYKRIDRNLNQYSIIELQNKASLNNFKELTKDDIIAIDLGDITKPHAEKMENIGKVADGSDGHKIKNGYWLLGSAAININSQEKTPLPLWLEIFSTHEISHKSENSKIISLLDKISFVHGNKNFDERPTVVIDRGGDRGVLLKHFIQINIPFVIRLCSRHLTEVETGEIIKIGKREIERDFLPYEATIKRIENTNKTEKFEFRFDYKKVNVTALKTKNEFFLITVWRKNSKKPIELMTNKLIQNNDDAIKIIISYLSRWCVEELYKYLKGNGLEKVRALNYFAIKNLIALCFLCSVFIARKIRFDQEFIPVIRRSIQVLKKHSRDLFNWLSQGGKACSALLKKIVRRAKFIHKRINFFAQLK